MAKTKQLGKVEPEFNERLLEYSNLIGMAKTDLLEELFYKEISDKVLNNDFIPIEEPYYFNFVELQKNKTVKATKIKPTADLNEVVIVKRIVNNLDVPEKELRTYCYNKNPEEHLGIYSYNKIVINEIKANDSQLFQYYLLFEFNKYFEEAIDRVKEAPEGTSFKDVLTLDNTYINLGLYLTSTLVIEPLSHAKGFSYSFLKSNAEAYEEITEGSKTSDLILIKDVIEDPENNTVHLITFNNPEGAVKNG